MAAQKRAATASGLVDKEKRKKRQITHGTFEKWQKQYNADYQTLTWLWCDTEKNDKSTVAALWCEIC